MDSSNSVPRCCQDHSQPDANGNKLFHSKDSAENRNCSGHAPLAMVNGENVATMKTAKQNSTSAAANNSAAEKTPTGENSTQLVEMSSVAAANTCCSPPSENEPGAVYTISGRRVVVSPTTLQNKIQGANNNAEEAKPFNRSEFVSTELWDKETQIEHHRCQCISETCSFIILILAVGVTLMTPMLLIPVYAFPNENAFYFQIALWSCSGLSIVLLSIGSLVGNIFWYKDGKRWRCFLHYGGNPKDHFWGKYLISKKSVKKAHPPEIV